MKTEGFIVFVAGKIGSGKTYIRKLLVEELYNATGVSISDTIRSELAKKGNTNPSREDLQEEGLDLVKDYWSFTKMMINFIKWEESNIYVIDGLRDMDYFKAFQKHVFPTPCFIIYLDGSEKIRKQRINERCEVPNEAHEVEQRVEEIREFADITTDSYIPIDELIQLVLELYRKAQKTVAHKERRIRIIGTVVFILSSGILIIAFLLVLALFLV